MRYENTLVLVLSSNDSQYDQLFLTQISKLQVRHVSSK